MPGNKKNTRKSAGVKKKIKTNTPVTIRQSAEDEKRMMDEPYAALELFRNDVGTSQAWYTLAFRLLVGQELARAYYTQEAVQGLADAKVAIDAIRLRFRESVEAQRWKASSGEIEMIRLGLEATDGMSVGTSRREQLDAHYVAHEFLQKTLERDKE